MPQKKTRIVSSVAYGNLQEGRDYTAQGRVVLQGTDVLVCSADGGEDFKAQKGGVGTVYLNYTMPLSWDESLAVTLKEQIIETATGKKVYMSETEYNQN